MSEQIVWRRLHWNRPLDPARAISVLRGWAADQRSPRLVLEARAGRGGIEYLLGAPRPALLGAAALLTSALPGTSLTALANPRPSVGLAMRLKASTRHRALRSDDPETAVRSILGALS